LGDRDSDVYGVGGQSGGFITVSGRVKLGSEPPVDVELDASEMSGFRRGGFSEVGALFYEEVGAFLASSFPGLIEPRSAPSPIIELIKVRQFWVVTE
jgi:hypothetical protein